MLVTANDLVRRCGLLAAGFVSNGSLGAGELDKGFGVILMGALLGAFCGLIFGFLSSHVMRFALFLTGRHVNGNLWTLCSVLLGAVVFAWLAANGSGEPEDVKPPEGLVLN